MIWPYCAATLAMADQRENREQPARAPGKYERVETLCTIPPEVNFGQPPNSPPQSHKYSCGAHITDYGKP